MHGNHERERAVGKSLMAKHALADVQIMFIVTWNDVLHQSLQSLILLLRVCDYLHTTLERLCVLSYSVPFCLASLTSSECSAVQGVHIEGKNIYRAGSHT